MSLPKIPEVSRPVPTDPPAVQALQAYHQQQSESAEQALKSLDPHQRAILRQLLPVAARLGQTPLTQASPTEVGIWTAQLEHATELLSSRAPLIVTKSVFCTEILGFGRYDAIPEGSALRPGELIHVYCELRNVPCSPLPGHATRFQIQLKTHLRIRSQQGNDVDLLQSDGRYGPVRSDVRLEQSESRVRDYFVPFRFSVPRQPGQYKVHLEIVDPAQGRYVSSVMPLRVGDS